MRKAEISNLNIQDRGENFQHESQPKWHKARGCQHVTGANLDNKVFVQKNVARLDVSVAEWRVTEEMEVLLQEQGHILISK